MQWLRDLVEWLSTDAGRSAIVIGLLLLVAVIVASLVLGAGARRVANRLLARHEQAVKTAAVATVIDSAKEASVWNTLTPQEQVLSDRAVGQAVTSIRLLPVRGAQTAADWAEYRLAELKRESATFGYQLDPAILELRDGLIDWMHRPRRAMKQFESDLARAQAVRSSDPVAPAVAEQADWAAAQHAKRYASTPSPEAGPSAGATAPAPAAQPTAALPTTTDHGARAEPVPARSAS